MLQSKKIIVHTDGGSRGNPGPAALGVVISDENGRVIKQYGEYLGVQTNNYAEYMAPISALKKIKSIVGSKATKDTEVAIYADSELMVNQLEGRYKIMNEKIKDLFIELWNLKVDYRKVSFRAIPREQNKGADRMVNEALDANMRPKQLL